MREIAVGSISDAVASLCMAANYELGDDMQAVIATAIDREESPTGIDILKQLQENAAIAAHDRVAICQDTGLAVVFVEVGQEVHLVGGDLSAAINDGVRRGYQEGFLRKSSCHPFTRKNTGDNTPAIIHYSLVPGDKVKIIVAPKGGGSENMSKVVMLKPADGIEGIKREVVAWVQQAGANPCPPTIVGVGIGGTFERAALLAKEALLRPAGDPSADPELALLEKDLLAAINELGIGPQGLGGRVTSFAVHVKMLPCHIASLPLAINIQCHAARHKEVVI
ncbi:MAG: fumarate hydratase [Deltaproteobacteria bacterium]|nr:fumarate hydratase [Candidatus Anaeroferrophillus wilburensis]MBN2890035.1 fumarate hydratase [Deltaproteobacteria bacterium]